MDAQGLLTSSPTTSSTTESNESNSSSQTSKEEEDPTSPSSPSVLVHCQCGISRSAAAVIAYVMQSAALGHHPELLSPIRGMHDAYSRVKELSPAISPNCSLLYQLIEWERHLTALTTRTKPHRDEDKGSNISRLSATEQERSETRSTLWTDSPASRPPAPNTGNLPESSQQAPSPATAALASPPSAVAPPIRPPPPTENSTGRPVVPRRLDRSPASATTRYASHIPPQQQLQSYSSTALTPSDRPLASPLRPLRSVDRLPSRPTLRVSAPDAATPPPTIQDLPLASAGLSSYGTPRSPSNTTFGPETLSPRSPASCCRTPHTPTSSRSAQSAQSAQSVQSIPSAQSTQSSVSHRLSLSLSESPGSMVLDDGESVPSSNRKFGATVTSPSLRRQLHRRTFSADVSFPASPSSDT